jgi:hypothetical protein
LFDKLLEEANNDESWERGEGSKVKGRSCDSFKEWG